MRGVLKRVFVRGIVALCSVLAALLSVEVLTRVLKPQQLVVSSVELYRADAGLGHRHRENVQLVLNSGEGPVSFVTDENGWRIPAAHPAPGAGPEISILALGDSFLEAESVPGTSTLPAVLESMLSRRNGKRVAVANTGVSDWNPNHYLVEAERCLSRNPYHLGIVFLFLENDIVRRKAGSIPARQPDPPRLRIPRSLDRLEWKRRVWLPLDNLLMGNSHAYMLAGPGVRTTLWKLGVAEPYLPEAFRRSFGESGAWQTTTEICTAIRDRFAKYHTPVFFVLIPSHFQVEEPEFYDHLEQWNIPRESMDLDQPNRILKETFQAAGLPFVDLLAGMRERARGGVHMYGRRDRHWNATGQRVAAELILATVEEYLAKAPRGGGKAGPAHPLFPRAHNP